MSEDAELLANAEQRVGSVLHGKYRIERVLGVGGMATVYAATHRNRKRFAIKILHPELSVRRDVRSRFVREGYAANSVSHPGAVVILDDDVDEAGAPFLVMELLEGVTVEALCAAADEPIPLRAALAIAYQLLDVLEAAHEKSVVHRDVKPANLFVLRDGQLKVVDFGIARLRDVESGVTSTRTGATLGTPAFMAPEQAASREVDATTDIWATGATLFTMLSARFVHEGDNARQIMLRTATDPARSLGSVVPSLPAPVIELVDRALSFERAARWPSAAAMREAVLEAHRGLFDSTPVPGDLSALVGRRMSTAAASAPTEPSPVGSEERGIVTTTSTPVAADDGERKARTTWKLKLSLGSTAAALIGAAALFSLSKRTEERAPDTDSRPPAATRAPEARTPVWSTAPAPETPQETTPEPARETVPALAVRPTPSAGAIRVEASTRPKARASSRPSSTASSAPIPQATNPLKLELQ